MSHEKGDFGLAREIRAHLESGGFACWMAPDDIRGPTPWPQQVEQAIESCDVMLVVVSANANGSQHVSREVDLAVEYSKPLLPVRVEDVVPTGTLNYLLRLTQWIDLFPGSIADHATALQGMVGSMLTDGRRAAPPPAPPQTPQRARPVPKKAVIGLTAAALVAVGLGLGVMLGSGNNGSEDLTEVLSADPLNSDQSESSASNGTSESASEEATPVADEPDVPVTDGTPESGPVAPAAGTGPATLVSVAADGTQSDDHSANPALSGDGRFVTFDSLASNLIDGDSGEWRDVFVHDRETGETTRVSQVVGEGGAVEEGNGSSHDPRVSADGRYVVFTSAATNLDPDADDANSATDLYLHDRETGLNRLISLAPDGAQHALNSIDPDISDDATLIAYATYAEETRPAGSGTGLYTTWVHDTTTGTTTRLAEWSLDEEWVQIWSGPHVAKGGSMAVSGVPLLGAFVYERESQTVAEVPELRGRHQTMIPSPDGEWIIFASQENTLVPDDLNSGLDIFTYERNTGDISMLLELGGWALWVNSISSDGSCISVSVGDLEELPDVIVINTRDEQGPDLGVPGTITSFREEFGLAFSEPPEDAGSVELSGDCRFATFVSGAESGGNQNIFVKQIQA